WQPRPLHRDPHTRLRRRQGVLGGGRRHRRGLRSRVRVAGDDEQGTRAVARGAARGAGGHVIGVIDNYDSFTYNLVQYLGTLGATPEVWRNDEITVDELAAQPLEGLLVSPGPGEPRDAGISEAAIERLAGRVP